MSLVPFFIFYLDLILYIKSYVDLVFLQVFMYGSVQAAFQHGILAPFRRPRGDPPLPEPGQHQPQVQRIQVREHLALENDQLQEPGQQDNDGRLDRAQVHERNPCRRREKQPPAFVKTLVAADPPNSEDDTDSERQEQSEELEQNVSSNAAPNQQVQKEKPSEVSVAAPNNTKPPHSDSSSQSTANPENNSESSTEDVTLRPQQTERQSSRTDETVSLFPSDI